MKYKIVTLGCRTNQYESQAFRDQLEKLGYSEGDDADICIVNTCTVTEQADQRSRMQIRQLAKKNPRSRLFVTGCLAQRNRASLESIEGVERVISNEDKERLLEFAFPDKDVPEFEIEQFKAHTRAFVKVQDGCNSWCSYCIIPYVRGRSRSKQIPEVLKEVENLISNGYKEVVLTGINIGDFDGGGTLADLVRAVDAVDGLERLRISSIDPDEVDDDLLDAVINGKRTCHSMHIVLQSGSNSVLKRMRRKYTRQEFFHTFRRLREASPRFTFTTDIIVGFPGESEEDFSETLDAMEKVRFAKVHMFPYSVRPGTRAARYTDFVAPEIIARRKQELLRLSERIAFDLREEYVGQELDVLLEGEDEEHICGHTENFLNVSLPKGELRSNQIVRAKLLENTPKGLIACLV
ncbi:MAG: tRNA (N(6)-L-threonylcarbamoyladenosine(37)-C(2))-methylthiotransferase MtaB [Simkaniaceae bacterium]|nr:tRNA (N(6)-L-threonylcarbamoyladenosine(37)-C(2))-methylthiotransferase MtaB [Simkaniaceae bacterium]